MSKEEYVTVDTLPETANHILNLLWERNGLMRVPEIQEALQQEFQVE